MLPKAKEPVRLREKKLSNGNTSLYLDIYVDGKRSYEFLKLYLIPEVSREDRAANQRTMQLANAVKAQRIVEVQNGAHGFRQSGSVALLPYMEVVAAQKNKSTAHIWKSHMGALRRFVGNELVTVAQANTREWAEAYLEFLNGCGYKPNTVAAYFSVMKTFFNQCVRSEVVDRNRFADVKAPAEEEAQRAYLTLEEVRLLAAHIADDSDRFNGVRLVLQRRAFVFSCLTGLRISDIMGLAWADVAEEGGRTRLTFRQQKTKGQEYLDINAQARALMGDKQEAGELVFPLTVTDRTVVSRNIRKWAASLGIRKHLTFHSGRHTFAVLMLDLGTDIYTVSKLLGHTNVQTTQIYAKILDKNKQKAVDAIPDIFSGPEE